MIVTASEQGYRSNVVQTVDGVISANYKWFSLQENLLDGSFHPVGNTHQYGWWGSLLSDSSGNLSSAPNITYEDVRSVQYLRVVGDDKLNEYPVDFTVKLYSGLTLLHTETVVGNTLVSWTKQLGTTYDTTKTVVTITKINKANRVLKIIEAINPFYVNRTDLLTPKLTALGLAGALIAVNSTDSLTIKNTEAVALTVSFGTADTLLPKLTNISSPHNVYTMMNELARQVFAKIELLYTDPTFDPNIVLTSSGTAYNTNLDQVSDGIEEASYKFFGLDGNSKLDGTYHPINSSLEVGWWSSVVSDLSGQFSINPLITLAGSKRSINILRLTGDDKSNVYAVDFTFDLYDDMNVLLFSLTITGNTQVAWSQTINTVSDVAKMIITIAKVNLAYSTARVLEAYPVVLETYYGDRIMEISILEEMGYQSGSLPLGNISANEIDVLLANFDRHFDANNLVSPLARYLKKNRRLKAWFGVEVLPNTIEWYPVGTFWTTSWNLPVNASTVSIVARDRLEMMRTSEFVISQLYVDITLYDLFELVLTDYGLIPSEYQIDVSLSSTVIPFAWFDRMSHREALQRIATIGIISIYVDHDGVVHVKNNPNGTDTLMWALDEKTNIYETRTPMAWAELTNFVEVTSQTWTVDTLQIVYSDSSVVSLLAGEEVTITYNFNNIPATNIQAPIIVGGSDIVVTSYSSYAWGMIISYKNNGVVAEDLVGVQISGQPLKVLGSRIAKAQDDQSILDDGKLKATVGHDFIQTSTYAQNLADNLLDVFGAARYDLDLDDRGCIALRLNDQANFVETTRVPAGNYMVLRQTMQYNGAFSAGIQAKKVR